MQIYNIFFFKTVFTEDSLCAAFFYLKDNLESFQEDHKDLIKAVLPDEDDSESPLVVLNSISTNKTLY